MAFLCLLFLLFLLLLLRQELVTVEKIGLAFKCLRDSLLINWDALPNYREVNMVLPQVARAIGRVDLAKFQQVV